MVDILRNLENTDVNNIILIHIFITQFLHKFDMQSTFLVRDYYMYEFINF